MSSPRSVVEYFPQGSESTHSSTPKLPRQNEYVPTGLLHDLRPELLGKVLALLAPDLSNPVHEDCGLVHLSRASKHYRHLALGGHGWKAICVARWTNKVGFEGRLAKAEEEASEEMDTDSCISGSYWYRKFGVEEVDASRSRITPSELSSNMFSIRLWFFADSYPPTVKKQKGVVPSGVDGVSISDDMRFLSGGRSISGLPDRYSNRYYEMNDDGTIVNFGTPLKEGTTHPWLSLQVCRRPDWGWELRSNLYVIRSIAGLSSIDEVWKDYTTSLVVEERKEDTKCRRLKSRQYKYREVPDIRELKQFLVW